MSEYRTSYREGSDQEAGWRLLANRDSDSQHRRFVSDKIASSRFQKPLSDPSQLHLTSRRLLLRLAIKVSMTKSTLPGR
jgi:hypothetical protein